MSVTEPPAVTAALPSASPASPASPAPRLRPRRPMWLVAEREIRQRVRAKSFRVTTAIALLAVAAAIIVPHALSSKKNPTAVGVVGNAGSAVAPSLANVETSTGVKLRTVPIADQATADAELRSGQIKVAITSDAVIVKRAFADDDTSSLARVAEALAETLGLQRGIRANGIDPAAAGRALSAPPLPIQGLEARTPSRSAARTTALFGSIFLYVFLSLYGSWILTGVVEEKTSRVVEVLLSTLRPRELLAGKIFGIGAVALAQGLAIVLTALVCAGVTGSNYLTGTNVTQLVATFGWFLLGFALYATLYGAAGSLVTRQEEAQNAAFPVGAPLLVAYLASFSLLAANHGNPFLTVLSFFPLTAPIAMPVRVAVGAAGPVDVFVSIAIMVLAIVLIANLAARVYTRSILHTGTKLSWRQALKSRSA